MNFREGFRLSRVFKAGGPQSVFQDNRVKTSVYNNLNFIPLNLLKQFSMVSNIYFLVRRLLTEGCWSAPDDQKHIAN